jgi:hypothetical protein
MMEEEMGFGGSNLDLEGVPDGLFLPQREPKGVEKAERFIRGDFVLVKLGWGASGIEVNRLFVAACPLWH